MERRLQKVPRWPLLIVALASFLMTGCTDAGRSGDDADDDPSAGLPAPLALAGCHEQIGIFPVTAAQAAPYIPDDFALLPPLPPDLHPGADPTGATGTLLFVGFFCIDPEVAFLVPWFPAVPPDRMQVSNATYHSVAGVPIVQGVQVTDWFVAAGLPFLNGSVLQDASPLSSPVSMASTMAAEAVDTRVSVEGTSPDTAAATPNELLPLFLAQDRQVVGRLDLHIGEHIHWQFGQATAEVTGFLQPPGPGLSTHSEPGMTVTLVAGRLDA